MTFFRFSVESAGSMAQRRWQTIVLALLSLAMVECAGGNGVMDASTDAGANWFAANTASGGNVVICRVGYSYNITCNPACGGGPMSCANDPYLLVCDGSLPLSDCTRGRTVIAQGDDSCGNMCPSVNVMCPSSGSFLLVGYEKRGGIFYCIPTVTMNM